MNLVVGTNCPHCGKPMDVGLDVVLNTLAPNVRCGLKPSASVMVYRITSDDIKRYLIRKGRKYVADVKMEVVPRYCEVKRKTAGHHGSYASLRIAFSEHVVEKNADNGWFGKIGEGGRVRVIKSLFDGFIQKFRYDKKTLDAITNSYRDMEALEDRLGITEEYLKDLKAFAVPATIKTNTGETWVFFSADASKVISDMLSCEDTNKVAGRIVIQDVSQITKDSVEFLVYLYPEESIKEDDPSVRKILLGEEKGKK